MSGDWNWWEEGSSARDAGEETICSGTASRSAGAQEPDAEYSDFFDGRQSRTRAGGMDAAEDAGPSGGAQNSDAENIDFFGGCQTRSQAGPSDQEANFAGGRRTRSANVRSCAAEPGDFEDRSAPDRRSRWAGSAGWGKFGNGSVDEPIRRTRTPESSAPYREGAHTGNSGSLRNPAGTVVSGGFGTYQGQNSGTLDEFVMKIEKCERTLANFPEKGWRKWKWREKLARILLNVFLWGIPFLLRMWFPIFRFDRNLALTATEKEKLAIIDNFYVANDRNSTIGALFYIRGKMENLSGAHAMERPDFWMGVWMDKADQLCSQAELFCPGDETILELREEIEDLCVTKQNNMRLRRVIFLILIALDALFLVLVWSGNASGSIGNTQAQYIWPENEFTELLPDPISERGKILTESTETFSIELYSIRQIQFENYILDCKENGFTEDFNRAENVCTASNSDGYLLVLSYDEKEKSMTVTVSYPEESQSVGVETE